MEGAPASADAMRHEAVPLRDGRVATVRPVREDDAQALIDNVNAVGAEEVFILTDQLAYDLESERAWIRGLDGARSVMFVAEVGGRVVAQADAHGGRPPKEVHVGTVGIAIVDGYRGIGLGRALMARILEWMRDRRFRKASLQVFSTNARAIALYKSLGFQVEGVRRQQYSIRGEWVDDVMMGLWLDAAGGPTSRP